MLWLCPTWLLLGCCLLSSVSRGCSSLLVGAPSPSVTRLRPPSLNWLCHHAPTCIPSLAGERDTLTRPIARVPILLPAPGDCSRTNTPSLEKLPWLPIVLGQASWSCHSDIAASRASLSPSHPPLAPHKCSFVLYALNATSPHPRLASPSSLWSCHSVIAPHAVPGTSHVPLSIALTCSVSFLEGCPSHTCVLSGSPGRETGQKAAQQTGWTLDKLR